MLKKKKKEDIFPASDIVVVAAWLVRNTKFFH